MIFAAVILTLNIGKNAINVMGKTQNGIESITRRLQNMNREHKMIDGTAMVSYLNYRKSLCTIKIVRVELEMAINYIVGTLMKENKDGES